MPEVIRHPADGGTGGLDSGLRRNDVTGDGGGSAGKMPVLPADAYAVRVRIP